MKERFRAMVVPFFMVLFPALWYLNRNILSEQLYPYIEPTLELVTIYLGVSVLGSVVFATVFAVFRQRDFEDERELTYGQRVFQPDQTAIVIFLLFVFLTFVLGLIEQFEIGPSWIGDLLPLLLVPLGLPMLVLAPLAIAFHWAVILGLVLCVLWMSLLANKLSDSINRHSQFNME